MLTELIAAVKTVAREEIMPRYLKVAYSRKADGSILTEADIASQAALSSRLRQLMDAPVLAEEMPEERQRELWQAGTGDLWCLDPIDGTSNFVKGLPYFAVSVALLHDRRPVLGLVYNPVCDDVFYAKAGRGAYYNGERLDASVGSEKLAHSVAGVDFKRLDPALSTRLAAHPPYSSQRNYGSSALDWCLLATRRIDLYVHGGQKIWDYMAGALILAEAGGVACTLEHDDFWADDPFSRPVVAAGTPAMLSQWRDWLRQKA